MYLIILAILSVCLTPTFAVNDSWEDIHLFQVFDSDVDHSHVTDIAKYYDFVWGATVKNVQDYLSASDIVLSKYLPFNRDPDSTHSLFYWSQIHPDWVIYQCDKKTPLTLFGDPNLVLDISNPDVIQWQKDAIIKPAKAAGYHMLALDGLGLGNYWGACGIYRGGQWVQLYSGINDPQYRIDALHWLQEITATARNTSLGLAILYSKIYSQSDADLEIVMNAADAIVDSRGFTEYGAGFANRTAFIAALSYMQYVQSRGKAFYSINQYPVVNSRVLNWVLASYLLGKEHSAYVYVTVNQDYGSVDWYKEYGAKIGSPTSDVKQLAPDVYSRDYTNGLVFVNAGKQTYNGSLTLPALNLDGQQLGKYVIVGPQQGIVLLYNYTIQDSPFSTQNSSDASGLTTTFITIVLLFCLLFV